LLLCTKRWSKVRVGYIQKRRLGYRTKEWDADFRAFLTNLRKQKPTILTGDLNVAHQEIDIFNPKGNKKSAGFTIEERTEFSKLLEDGWVDSFRELHPETVKYSYFNVKTNARAENKGWRLDYFVASKDAMKGITASEINDLVYGSDHLPVELTLDLSKL
jgi:exodeoxyribonuclease III